MNNIIKRNILIIGLAITMVSANASFTTTIHAAKVDVIATKQYQDAIKNNHKASQKLAGKNDKYATYTFKLSKATNAYYLHWLDNENEHQVIGKKLLPKGTIVYANRANANGIDWDVKTNHVHLSQGVSMTMVLTNQNAQPVSGDYHKILEKTVQHLK